MRTGRTIALNDDGELDLSTDGPQNAGGFFSLSFFTSGIEVRAPL